VAFAVASALLHLTTEARQQRIARALGELHLGSLGDRRIQNLSGGEKQRVALARALSIGPRALLLDDPLSALDVHSRNEVRSFLANYLETLHIPTIVVTHDAKDAQLVGAQIVVLEAGRVTQRGQWHELVNHPASSFVREFVRSQ
jgi:uncharacterized spore protein YtfJ